MERLIQKRIEIVTSSLQGFQSLTSQNILNLILYLIKNAISLSKTNVIKLRTKDLRDFLSHRFSDKELYDLLIELIQSHIKTSVFKTVKDDNEYWNEPENREIELTAIFRSIKWIKNEKYIEIHLNEDFIKYSEEKARYVTVLLSTTQNAKSKYTPKFLEFISSYVQYNTNKTNNSIKLATHNIRKVLAIKNDEYKEFKTLKSKVLKKIQEDSQRLGLNFSFTTILAQKEGTKRKQAVGIEINVTNDEKRKFQKKLENHKHKKLHKDQLLKFVCQHAKQDTIQYLKSKLYHNDEFNAVIESIESGERYTIYKFIYHDRFENGLEKFKLISFYDLDVVITYFTTCNEEEKEFLRKTRFIQDILNQTF